MMFKELQKVGSSSIKGILRRHFHSTTYTTANQHLTHYEILHLPRTATSKQIKSSFKKLSLKHHPDILKSATLSHQEREKHKDKYIRIVKSYEVLSNPSSKSQYDSSLGGPNLSGYYNPEMSKHARSNAFHYNSRPPRYAAYKTAYSYSPNNPQDDVPHFDAVKHLKRNLKNERRVQTRRMVQDGADIISHDLSSGYFRQPSYHYNRASRSVYNRSTVATNANSRYSTVHNPPDSSDGASTKILLGVLGSLGLLYFGLKKSSTNSNTNGNSKSKSEISNRTAVRNQILRKDQQATKSDYSSMLLSNAVTGGGNDKVETTHHH